MKCDQCSLYIIIALHCFIGERFRGNSKSQCILVCVYTLCMYNVMCSAKFGSSVCIVHMSFMELSIIKQLYGIAKCQVKVHNVYTHNHNVLQSVGVHSIAVLTMSVEPLGSAVQ